MVPLAMRVLTDSWFRAKAATMKEKSAAHRRGAADANNKNAVPMANDDFLMFIILTPLP
jgi:hypothetical protein